MKQLKSAFKILLNHNLVIEKHCGIYTVNEYIKFKKKLAQNQDFTSNLNYLLDLRHVIFQTTREDIQNFSQYIKSNQKILGKRKIALLTNTPSQVVTTTIYQFATSNKNNIIEIFSTKLSAFTWLQVNEEKVNTELNNLKPV